MMCAICLEDIYPIITNEKTPDKHDIETGDVDYSLCTLSCKHIFHTSCFLMHVKNDFENGKYSVNCPMCRRQVIELTKKLPDPSLAQSLTMGTPEQIPDSIIYHETDASYRVQTQEEAVNVLKRIVKTSVSLTILTFFTLMYLSHPST